MLLSIKSYIETMNDTGGLTRTLGVIDVCRRADGMPDHIVGNSSVLFRIRCDGRPMVLKCYTRPRRNIRRIYGQRCLREELFVHTDGRHGIWTDVVLADWIEGRTLRRAVADSAGDAAAFGRLACEFDRLAFRLLGEKWAHGDLKPDNIIVDGDGRMHLIDFDAVFFPEFAGEVSDETGTAAFQHPKRSAAVFDKSIDDYPAALISTALHAMSVDATLGERFESDELLLVDPREAVAGKSEALRQIAGLFGDRCMAVEYRIAELLTSRVPRLCGLHELFGYAVENEIRAYGDDCRIPALAVRDGRWGYALDGRFVIPPLYDEGFEFSEGLAAVSLGGCRHYIGPDGRQRINCNGCESAKPFSDGVAAVVRDGCRIFLNSSGVAVDPPPSKIGRHLLISVK